MIKPIMGLDPDECDHEENWWAGRKARTMNAGCTRAERRRAERHAS
jgi:hypothetical protein